MNRSSRWALLAAALALGGGALAVHLVSASGSGVRSGRVRVRSGSPAPPFLEIRGNVLDEPGAAPQRLDAVAFAPLVGTQAPLAARSPDGAYLAYGTFAYARDVDRTKSYAEQGIQPGDALGTPRIRVRDLASKTETPLEPGSQAPAWREDGALAYVVGDPPQFRADIPFLTNVFVRSSPGARPVAWTSDAARYSVLGWAGRTLLVQREAAGAAADLLAFDAPEHSHVVAPSASLVATSPDGTEILVADSPAETPTPQVRVVRVADGSTVAAAFVADARDPLTNAPLTWILGPGSWVRDRVVASASSGLVVMRVGAGIDFEQVLHVDSATQPDAALFEPRFADDARTIVAWGAIPGTQPVRVAQLVCDRSTLTCTRGPAVPADTPPRPVFDTSGGTR